MSVELEVFPDDAWGATVGARLVARLAAQPAMRICLPTGNTPVPAYRAFADLGGRLDRADLFLLDEFGLPPGHPARCDEMMARSLLDLDIAPPARVHGIDVDGDDAAAACRRYDQRLAAGGLDLAILGLGANGHLGLNEPGSAVDSPSRVVELSPTTIRNATVYGAGVAPQWGVTIGMAPLLASREIWLLVTGAHKASILRRALTGPIEPDVPASYLQRHGNTHVLADQSAAARFEPEA